MVDLVERLRQIENNPSPELWNDIASRTPSHAPDRQGTRQRLAAGLVAAVVAIAALAFLVYVFRPQPGSDSATLGPSAPETPSLLVSTSGPSSDTALLAGYLIDESGCVAVSERQGPFPPVFVIWPTGYSLSVEDGRTWLTDDNGSHVAAIGDLVQMGGGMTNLTHAEGSVQGGIPTACENGGADRYWFAGTPELVKSLTPGDPLSELYLPTAGSKVAMQALFRGSLVVRNGCVLAGDAGSYMLPIWQDGFTAARDGDGRVVVQDENGMTVAIEGSVFEMGGGYIAEFEPKDKVDPREMQLQHVTDLTGNTIPMRCLGPDVYGVWWVGETQAVAA